MRYLEYHIVIGEAPLGLIIPDIMDLTPSMEEEEESIAARKERESSLWQEGVVHHLSKETYFWNFSLVYKAGNFDVIKWKNSNAWKSQSGDLPPLVNKALFIGADAGLFFIAIDENIDENFTKLADMMDVFIEKTKHDAPFLVYGLIENKQKIAELKTNKEMLKNLADVKNWTVKHGGEFKLENLTEVKQNLTHMITEYCHNLLLKLRSQTSYKNLNLAEVHFLDNEDLISLKEIEESLLDQVKAGQTIDDVISGLIFELLEKPEFKEEIVAEEPIEPLEEEKVIAKSVVKPEASKIKQILREIRLGIRRQCPSCFNLDRSKIREVIDRNNIIMQNPNIFGMKLICGSCGFEWSTGGVYTPQEE